MSRQLQIDTKPSHGEPGTDGPTSPPDSIGTFNAAAAAVVAVAALVSLVLSRLVLRDSDLENARTIAIVVAIGVGALIVLHLVADRGLVRVATSAAVAVVVVVAALLTGIGGSAALFALAMTALLFGACVALPSVSGLVLAFPLWMIAGSVANTEPVVLALGIGLTAVIALQNDSDPGGSVVASVPRETDTAQETATATAAPVTGPQPTSEERGGSVVVPSAPIPGDGPPLTTLGDGLDSKPAFGLADHPAFEVPDNEATVITPPSGPLVSDQPVNLFGDDASEGFHMVLGEPSRADGALGEITPMPAPFSAASEADQFAAGNWTIQARSSRGASHVHGGEHRQDSYALARSTDGKFVIAAISDGLGSAERSNFGSYVATRIAVANLARTLTSAVDVAAALRDVPAQVASQMDELGRGLIEASPNEIAATLVLTVVPADEPAPIWLARVGDSDALVLTAAGKWASGFGGGATEEELESGTTDVLPHHADRVEVRTIDGSKAQALLLATDGVARVMEGSPDIVGAAFAERLAEPVDAIAFQRLIDFKRKGAHDDRTAIAMWHRPKGQSR